jgi:hypothetical protein
MKFGMIVAYAAVTSAEREELVQGDARKPELLPLHRSLEWRQAGHARRRF